MFAVPLLLTLLAASCSALEVTTYNLFLFNTMSAATDTNSQNAPIDPKASIIEQSDITAIQGGGSLESVQAAFLELQKKDSYWKVLDLGPKERGPHHVHEYVGFIYRSDRVALDQLRIVWDPKENFETTPFSVLVKPLVDDVRPFVMAIVYLSETNTLQELDNLPTLYKDLKRDYDNQNVLIGGEFHTGCDYLTDEKFNEAKVSNSNIFQWFSVASSDEGTPRGRFLAAGRDLRQDITSGGCHALAVPYSVGEEAIALTLDGTTEASNF